MLSNAYFIAKIRFDTAENEPAKNLQNFAPILLMLRPREPLAAGASSGDQELREDGVPLCPSPILAVAVLRLDEANGRLDLLRAPLRLQALEDFEEVVVAELTAALQVENLPRLPRRDARRERHLI